MAQERPRGATPRLRPGVAAGRSNPTPEARGSGWQEQPHVAAWAQKGLEELFHVQGQEGRGEEILLVKVRSSGCALLEQLNISAFSKSNLMLSDQIFAHIILGFSTSLNLIIFPI